MKIPVERRSGLNMFDEPFRRDISDSVDSGEAVSKTVRNETDIGIDIVASPPGKKK